MIQRLLSLITGKPAVKRSPQWPAVRKAHLEYQPRCQACGGMDSLNVHHRIPVHLRPDAELAHQNLITLCESGPGGMNCHFVFGHCGKDWRCYNPAVDLDVAAFFQIRQRARYDA